MEAFGSLFGALDALGIAKALLAAFVCGQLIAWTYELTYHGLSYSRGFAQTLVLLSVSSATVVAAMSHSLLAGLGLLGIISLVRFRSTLKAPRDLVFVLGAATVGIASGVVALVVAAAGTLAFCGIALYLHHGAFGARARYDGVLRFRVPAGEDVEPRLAALLDRHCRRRSPLSIAEVAQGTRLEHAYQVKFRTDDDAERLLASLRTELKAAEARLLLQEATFEY